MRNSTFEPDLFHPLSTGIVSCSLQRMLLVYSQKETTNGITDNTMKGFKRENESKLVKIRDYKENGIKIIENSRLAGDFRNAGRT